MTEHILFFFFNCKILGGRSVFTLETFPVDECFVWDGQLVFMTERYRYASCALTIKKGNHLTASMCNSLVGKGLFLSVAPSVLPTVSWTLDKAHFDIVLIR